MSSPSAAHRLVAGDLVAIADAYRPLPGPPPDRPWITVSMVQSLDGGTAFDGRSGPLGSPVDQAVFAALRSTHDVSLVGASTARAENYQPLRRPGHRLAVVTASGRLPFDEPVYQHDQTVIVLPEDVPLAAGATTVRAGRGRVDLNAAIAQLAPRRLLVEGGSSLNGQMLALGLVDEICLTVSPIVIGGSSPRVGSHGSEFLHHFALLHTLVADDLLFLRYVRGEEAG
jgi:riboflavin biosynthesis pyrimidine reductase